MLATLCFLLKDDQVLLGYKKRGFGAGKWNGLGGKLNKDESPESAAVREVWEEVGIRVNAIESLGTIEFVWPKSLSHHNALVFVYRSFEFKGEARESEECRPAWYKISDIPYHEMWEDDRYWYPDMLAGKVIHKKIVFNNKEQIELIEDL